MVKTHGLLSLEGWGEGKGRGGHSRFFRVIALIERIAIMEAR